MKDTAARLQRAVLLVGIVVLGGAAWYRFVEGFSPLDALFMAVTTITTVGYREVQPLDRGGMVFTMGYILVGVGLLFYTAVAIVESVLVGDVTEALGLSRQSRRVRRLERHHILCGFGRVGQEIARELAVRKIDFVIIDRDAAQQVAARELGYLTVVGDATEEDVLREAGVDRARVLIAASDSDVGNTFVALTARALNPQLTIIARAASDSGARRMIAAGADDVISPYQIAGHRMAIAAVDHAIRAAGPPLTDAATLVEVAVSPAEGATRLLGEAVAGLHSVYVLGVRTAAGEVIRAPGPDYALRAGDRLMLYGARDEIDTLCADEALDRVGPAAAPGALGPGVTAG